MIDREKIIDGFASWIENEENGVCYIPRNLCEKIMKLLKEQGTVESKTGYWIESIASLDECFWWNKKQKNRSEVR